MNDKSQEKKNKKSTKAKTVTNVAIAWQQMNRKQRFYEIDGMVDMESEQQPCII
jgi:hypothetical protein